MIMMLYSEGEQLLLYKKRLGSRDGYGEAGVLKECRVISSGWQRTSSFPLNYFNHMPIQCSAGFSSLQ
jgi:hypothetical protein